MTSQLTIDLTFTFTESIPNQCGLTRLQLCLNPVLRTLTSNPSAVCKS